MDTVRRWTSDLNPDTERLMEGHCLLDHLSVWEMYTAGEQYTSEGGWMGWCFFTWGKNVHKNWVWKYELLGLLFSPVLPPALPPLPKLGLPATAPPTSEQLAWKLKQQGVYRSPSFIQLEEAEETLVFTVCFKIDVFLSSNPLKNKFRLKQLMMTCKKYKRFPSKENTCKIFFNF